VKLEGEGEDAASDEAGAISPLSIAQALSTNIETDIVIKKGRRMISFLSIMIRNMGWFCSTCKQSL